MVAQAAKDRITDTSGNGYSSFDSPSGTAFSTRISASNVYIWPNPAREKIRVYVNSITESDEGECIIYNNSGQPVLKQWIRNGNNDIYLGNVEEGLYIVTIATRQKHIISKRILINR
jgi:hypothetical protein